MNHGSLYAQITGRKDPPKEQPSISPAEQQILFQQKTNWLEHPTTQELFKELSVRIEGLEEQARSQAASFHTHQNPNLIVKLLVHILLS